MNGESFASFLLVSVFFANLEANYTPLDKFKIAKQNVHSWQKVMHLNMEQKHLTPFPHENQHTFVCLQKVSNIQLATCCCRLFYFYI